MQIQRCLLSRHIPETLKEGQCTNTAYENSYAGTATAFINAARRYSMRTAAVIGFLAVKEEIIGYILFHPLLHLLGWGISLLPSDSGSTTASLHPKLNCDHLLQQK